MHELTNLLIHICTNSLARTHALVQFPERAHAVAPSFAHTLSHTRARALFHTRPRVLFLTCPRVLFYTRTHVLTHARTRSHTLSPTHALVHSPKHAVAHSPKQAVAHSELFLTKLWDCSLHAHSTIRKNCKSNEWRNTNRMQVIHWSESGLCNNS